MIWATVSGSFRRHLTAVYEAVQALRDAGVHVVSPADPRVVDQVGSFLFVASDRVRSVRLVQDRHLEAIAISDFLWLVTPDGYIGQSASMEIGLAVASGTPIYATTLPSDVTLREYVTLVPNIPTALNQVALQPRSQQTEPNFLVSPDLLEFAHDSLDVIRHKLSVATSDADKWIVEKHRARVLSILRRLRTDENPDLSMASSRSAIRDGSSTGGNREKGTLEIAQ